MEDPTKKENIPPSQIRLVTAPLKGEKVNPKELGIRPRNKQLTEEAKRIWAKTEPVLYVSFLSVGQSNLPLVPVQAYIYPNEEDETSAIALKLYALFDTGAQISIIARNLLPPELQHLDCGEFYTMALRFGETNEHLDVTFTIREEQNMPNQSSILVLGQHSLIDSIIYSWRGARIKTNPKKQVQFICYRDSVLDSDCNFTPKIESFADFQQPAQV